MTKSSGYNGRLLDRIIMDDGFDPCEYVWSHEMAVRRLLSLLRHSQTYCTDNECLTELPGSNIDSSGGNLLFVFCWFFLAVVLCFLRAAAFRRRGDTLKSRDHEHDSSGDPSAPTPLC